MASAPRTDRILAHTLIWAAAVSSLMAVALTLACAAAHPGVL